ncbi:MAG: glycosyltransferase family 9 protein [Gemmatimonas sp.]
MKSAVVSAARAMERAARGQPADAALDHGTVRNFLFLQYEQALGSAVHATPVFEALKAAAPDTHVAVACHGVSAEVLQHNPYIDRLIVTPNPYRQLFSAARAIRRAWSALEPRCIVTTPGNTRTRIALLAVLCGRALRIGHTLAPALYHRVSRYDRSESLIHNTVLTLADAGLRASNVEPKVFFSSGDLMAARRELAAHGLDGSRPLAVLVTQVSGGQPTRWHDERFLAVAEHLHERHGYAVAFVGTTGESAEIDRLRGRLSFSSLSLAGRLTVPSLSAVLCLADVGVALDTGPLHVGRAAGLPMVVIAPAWQPAIEWLPLGLDRFEILRGSDLPTAPAGYAIDEISAQAAIAAVDRLIARYPPSASCRQERVARSLAASGFGPAATAESAIFPAHEALPQ